ncbi:MAG: hypothetical protein RIQ74_359 [Pseudomonadota bacterium]|jgi:hypothetical protein
MLASNILKLRLDRIEQQGHHLSVKDQLKLVTLAQPELTAGLYSQLFQVTLPKIWHFQHHNAEEIACSLRLIELIDRVFIPKYKQHAHRFAWFEQCLVFRLQYADQGLNQQDLYEVTSHLEKCKESPQKLSILKQLHDQYDEIAIQLALAKAYQALQDWSPAIEIYQRVVKQQATQLENIDYDFIYCLLNRNYSSNQQKNSDVIEALQRLAALDPIQQQAKHTQFTQWAVSLMLPESMQLNSMDTTIHFISLQRRLKQVGYSLNDWLIANDFIIPYYKNSIEKAPKLLNNHEIVVNLDRHKLANTALKAILTNRDLKLVSGVNAANYSLGFIWNYLQINPLVLDALVAASQASPDAFYNLKQIPAPDYDHDAALQHLSSYLAKQQVAYNLSQQGHTIEFAEHSHLSGFDLIVDGTPMQVKCSLDGEAVEKFAQQHPHIAIIVNIELAHLQEKYPSIFADLALSHEAVQRTAQLSLKYPVGVDGYLPIPLMNTGFAVYRNFNQAQGKQVRPYSQPSSTMKNGLAVGAAIGGVVTGSIGAFVVGSLAVYRTWRIQKIEQRKPLQQKQQLLMQRNQIMDLLIDFAEWFNQNLLQYRVDIYAYQLRQIEMKLMGRISEAVISTTLFAYKFEAHQRAYQLHIWMQKQLADDNPKQKVQAGWVALAQSNQFMSVELKQRVRHINAELEKYKQMTRYGVQLEHLSRQPHDHTMQSNHIIPSMIM